MITTFDKAIVALILGAVFLINNLTSFHFAVSPETANAIAGLLAPILVYLVPNKPSAPSA